MFRSRALIVAFAVSIFAGLLRSPARAERVMVWLRSGRVLTGEVDLRSNPERLVLRAASASFLLTREVAWDEIKSIRAGAKDLTAATFRERIAEFATKLPEAHFSNQARMIPNHAATIMPRNAVPRNAVPRNYVSRNAATKVASLAVEARLANWDRDAEIDGLEIRIQPRNVFGNVVPVAGQLLATLVGRDQQPVAGRDAFPQLGRWSLQTDTNDFGPFGAVYRLPFRAAQPADNDSLALHGLLETTLFVFGQGRYEADAAVYLQQLNPVRRDLDIRQKRVINRR